MKKKVLILFLLAILIFVIYQEFPYSFPRRVDKVFEYLIEKNENNGNFEAVEKFYLKQIKFDEFWYKKFDISEFMFGVPKLKNQLIKFYISQNKYNEAKNMLHAKLVSKYSVPMDGLSYSDNKGIFTINKNIHDADTKYWLAKVYVHEKQYKEAYKYAKESVNTYENYLKSNKDDFINKKLINTYFLLCEIDTLEKKDGTYWIKKAEAQKKKYPNFDMEYNFNLSDYYFNKGNYKKAEDLLMEIYPNISIYPPLINSPKNRIALLYAKIQSRLGKIYQKQNRLEDADSALLKAYYIYEDLYGDYDEITLCSLYEHIRNEEKIILYDSSRKKTYKGSLEMFFEYAPKHKSLKGIDKNNYIQKMKQFCQ